MFRVQAEADLPDNLKRVERLSPLLLHSAADIFSSGIGDQSFRGIWLGLTSSFCLYGIAYVQVVPEWFCREERIPGNH